MLRLRRRKSPSTDPPVVILFVIPTTSEARRRNLLWAGGYQIPFDFAQGRLSRGNPALPE
jgi:hypothetical protein